MKEVKWIFDGMVMFKLNKFYFYLIDDEGWCLEIFGLFEFIEVGLKGNDEFERKES